MADIWRHNEVETPIKTDPDKQWEFLIEHEFVASVTIELADVPNSIEKQRDRSKNQSANFSKMLAGHLP